MPSTHSLFATTVRSCLLVCLISSNLASGVASAQGECAVSRFDCWSERAWADPPKSVRLLVRWWWPGAQVTEQGASSDLALLDRLGFGGVEIQPFAFGLTEDPSVTAEVRSVVLRFFAPEDDDP